MWPVYKGRVRITGGFWLLALWFWYANGLQTLGAVLGAAAAHEAGHWAVLRLLGVRVTGLRISAFGAEMYAPRGMLGYGGELAAILAGPAVNLAVGFVLSRIGEQFWAAAGVHLALGAFNLLPIRPLDGGNAVVTLGSWAAGPAAGERAARVFGVLTALTTSAFLAAVMWYSGGSLWLVPPLVGTVVAGGKELFEK